MNKQENVEFLPIIYKDEILYSTVARYHLMIEGNNLKDVIIKLFGKTTVIPSIEFPTNLEYFVDNFGKYINVTSDLLIKNHTALPYYSIFNFKDRVKEIKNEMKYGDGKGIKHKIGYIAGSICKKTGLYYCPSCLNEEYNKYGEGYFHRLHQLQGVFICNKHIRPLVKYPIDYKKVSRLKFIRLDDNINFNAEISIDTRNIDKFKKIVDLAEFIIISSLEDYDKKKLYKMYYEKLEEKSLTTINGQIRQRELCEEFINFWG